MLRTKEREADKHARQLDAARTAEYDATAQRLQVCVHVACVKSLYQLCVVLLSECPCCHVIGR